MEVYTKRNIILAWFKKLLRIQSPSHIADGYKYEYDFIQHYRRKYKNE